MCSSSVSILTELFVVPETSSIKFLQVRWANHCTWWERSVSLNHTKITINNIYPRQPRYQHKFRHREKLKMVEVKYPKRGLSIPPTQIFFSCLYWCVLRFPPFRKHPSNMLVIMPTEIVWEPDAHNTKNQPVFHRNDNDVSLAWCNYCIWVFRKTQFSLQYIYT